MPVAIDETLGVGGVRRGARRLVRRRAAAAAAAAEGARTRTRRAQPRHRPARRRDHRGQRASDRGAGAAVREAAADRIAPAGAGCRVRCGWCSGSCCSTTRCTCGTGGTTARGFSGASTPCTTSIAISIRPPGCGSMPASWRWRPAFRALQVALLGVDRRDAPPLAEDARRVGRVSPQQPRAAPRGRGAAERRHRDTAHARDPSFDAERRNRFQLREPAVLLGSAASQLCGSTSPQDAVTIGVDGFSRPEDVTLERSLTLPFRDDRRLLPPGAGRRCGVHPDVAMLDS